MSAKPTERTHSLLTKAEKWLRWCEAYVHELHAYGVASKHNDIERTFITLLSSITTVHEALDAAAKTAGLVDWAMKLDDTRNTDPLLFYVWKARDSESHDALTKWSAGSKRLMVKIVDEATWLQNVGRFHREKSIEGRAYRILFYVFAVQNRSDLIHAVWSGAKPLEENVKRSGADVRFLDTLGLMPFTARVKGKNVLVQRPTRHLGSPSEPDANYLVGAAVTFYARAFVELSRLLGHQHGLGKQSPPSRAPRTRHLCVVIPPP